MSLDVALTAARTGLALVNRQLAQSAADIANAGTPGYSNKRVEGRAVVAEGRGYGVRDLPTQRAVDEALRSRLDGARSARAGAALREELLGRIETAQGSIEGARSIGDLTANLRTALTDLRGAPSEPVRQSGVLLAADDLARSFRDVSAAITDARQAAQDTMRGEVDTLNAELRQVARLTAEIRSGVALGQSVADLEDQRDASLAKLSEVLDVRVLRREDGNITLFTRGGLLLPLERNGADPFSVADASTGPAAYYGPPGGTLPGVMLNGQDVTASLAGGRLAAARELRDATLPRMQAELDIAAGQLAHRLEGQGLRLFTDAAGAVPDVSLPYATSGMLGFSAAIRVNPAVAADPRLLRDGTHAVAGSPGGPSAFTPNPTTGPAGFTTLLDRALERAFGAEAQPGVAHVGFATAGLGPNGLLASTLGNPGAIGDYAAQLVAGHSGEVAAAGAARERSGALEASLGERFSNSAGVDVDAEMAMMVQLQNAYAANARVLSAVQQMYDQLFAAVR
jgi:flagellar hook-associated protein 1